MTTLSGIQTLGDDDPQTYRHWDITTLPGIQALGHGDPPPPAFRHWDMMTIRHSNKWAMTTLGIQTTAYDNEQTFRHCDMTTLPGIQTLGHGGP